VPWWVNSAFYPEDSPPDAVVFGRVELWGEVIEHEDGYRAEFASIVSLDCLVIGFSQLPPRGLLARLHAKYVIPGPGYGPLEGAVEK
jgi:hypothetical protein